MTVRIIVEGSTLAEALELASSRCAEAREATPYRATSDRIYCEGFEHFRDRLLAIIAKDQKTSPGLTVTLEQVRQKVEGVRMAKESQWPEIK